ncbi:hypothetical protein [Ancylobacter sp. FA202]|uniref:hypothetical protein n=1 Tax=Ancylobacter sp. FA202 TaxID=1111106 RepID=UPI000371F3F6|nr:hypothetical protein [Ancylobacter sp. FA202]
MNAHTREFVMVERRQLRERAERTIEALIAMLDELDGEPDLEGDDLEDDGDRERDEAEDGLGDWEGLIEQHGGSWNGVSVL